MRNNSGRVNHARAFLAALVFASSFYCSVSYFSARKSGDHSADPSIPTPELRPPITANLGQHMGGICFNFNGQIQTPEQAFATYPPYLARQFAAEIDIWENNHNGTYTLMDTYRGGTNTVMERSSRQKLDMGDEFAYCYGDEFRGERQKERK